MLKRLFFLICFSALVGGIVYYFAFLPIVPEKLKDEYIKIQPNTSVSQLTDQLTTQGLLNNATTFGYWASWLKFKNVRSGRFKIKASMNGYQLVNLLAEGEQAPVRVTLNNEKSLAQIAGKIARHIDADSIEILQAFNDAATTDSVAYNHEKLMCLFLPNTYEFFWNIDPKKIIPKMEREYKKFWTEERREKAKNLELTQEEVIIMASLVESETNRADERPLVASTYLNRLRKPMRLQCDPTVYYAVFLQRNIPPNYQLTKSDLQIQSPYSTYTSDGLPPGPIRLPIAATIDAVLNAPSTNYLYFCGEPNDKGKLLFAETFEQHIVNAQKFRAWLNSKGKL